MQDAPAFLLVVASAAEDIALRLNSNVCQRGIEYKGEAMAIINQRMTTLKNGTSDRSLTACALLAGFEVRVLFSYAIRVTDAHSFSLDIEERSKST